MKKGIKTVDNWHTQKESRLSELWHKIIKLISRKTHIITLLTATWIAALFSSCSEKSVDEQVRDIIEDKQEVVDDLADNKRDLEQELREVNIELVDAQRELNEAKALK